MRILSTLSQWLIVFIILGILSAIGIVSFDSLDEWITPTNILLGFIIIILFMIWLNVEKINIRAKYEEEKAQPKKKMGEFSDLGHHHFPKLTETSTEEDILTDEDREEITKERLSKLDDWKSEDRTWKKKL